MDDINIIVESAIKGHQKPEPSLLESTDEQAHLSTEFLHELYAQRGVL